MMEYYIVTIIFVSMLCGAIYVLDWSLENVEVSPNPNVQHKWEIAIKVLRFIIYGVLAYVLLETIIIIIAPLFERLNSAFNAAVSKILNFIDNIVPYAVVVGIGWACWRETHPKQITAPTTTPDAVAIEVARIRAKETYPFLLAFMFRVMSAVSQNGSIKRMGNPHDIETQAINGDHFYMQGTVAVFQFELVAEEEITLELADTIRDDLQKTGENYIGEHSELVSDEAKGRTPFEVLRVQPLGNRACVDVVLTTAASIALIDRTRQARIERQLRQKQNQGQADPFDPIFS